ncbi:MAG TPA: type 1 glutamine amidotransferase [Patescibacteria group bacterium]|nr:type 1 glutamine amidotransferase [Patescibacteria group bacterium]
MKKKILLIKNVTRPHKNLVEKILEEDKRSYLCVELDRGDTLPSLDNIGGVIVFGGPRSVNDESQEIRELANLSQHAIQYNIPFLGICLGFQILARVFSQKVGSFFPPEVGCRDEHGKTYEIELTDFGRGDPIFLGLPEKMPVFEFHYESVRADQKYPVIAHGNNNSVQAVKYASLAYGIQWHFEFTFEFFLHLLSHHPGLQGLDKEKLRKDYELFAQEYEKYGLRLFRNFLQMAD